MKKLLLLLLLTISFNLITGYAQIEDKSTSIYQRQTGIPIDDVNFRHNETVLDASDIENRARLINLRFDRGGGVIGLDDTKLIEDDAPATGVPEGYDSYDQGPVEWVEDLRRGIVIKKIFVVENPSAVSGRVVFKGFEVQGNKESLHLSLNGEKFVRPASQIAFPHARQYIDLSWDRWFYVDLPIEKLRQGSNELLMWAESDSTSWRILIAHEKEFKRGSLTRTSPNRSMKSNDGGQSWSDFRLGAMDEIDGEYSIRLSLDQYLPFGEYVSPLMDLVNGDDPIKRSFSNLSASFQPDVNEPAETKAKIFIRYGSSPFLGDEFWTAWQPLERGRKYSLANKRYLQWRAELSTKDPLVSPLIRGFRITSEWEDNSINTNAGIHAHVINNGIINPSSYSFGFENLDHVELKRFREDHSLDEIVKGATTEFEVMMRLLNWAYRVPLTLNEYSWNWNDVTVTPMIGEGTGLPQLNGPFFEGRRMVGMCLYPNQALIGALLAMGHQARHINIHSEGVSGHEVTEVWSNEFNKWVYMDATRDYYYFDSKTGIPLNLLEIHKLLVAKIPRVENWKRPFAPDIGKDVVSQIRVGMRKGNNPFSIAEDGTHILELMGHFRIIPRNDFLSHPLPVPLHTGETMWGWDGFLNWYDATFPKRDEYQNYSNRASDFYPPLNQTKVFLDETSEPGVISVVVEEFTPGGFDSFLVKVNDGAWNTENKSSWNWNLRSGMNNIEVRTRNVRGVLGPISHVGVTYNP